jgi:UDP-glucose 4-epimerase
MALWLVTGGAGFIGSHIVEELVRRGDHVRVLDNLTTGAEKNLACVADSVEFIVADIRDTDAVRCAMRGVDYVLHHAAIVSVPKSVSDPVTTHDVNVTGTLNVLLAARDANVKRFVLASSCSVYGDVNQLPLTEKCPTRPLSSYAASKLMGEVYCRTFHAVYGLPAVCLRYFNIYGARQNPNGDYAAVIPKFIHKMEAGRPPVIFGDGMQTRDFVHVSDVVRINLAVCESPQAVGQVFNVASGKETSLRELVNVLNSLYDAHLEPEFQPSRKGDILRSVGSSDLLADVTGLRVEMSLTAGLRRQVMQPAAFS